MKHLKLWTVLALPLLLGACSKSDRAGVAAPDCLNISGEWSVEGTQLQDIKDSISIQQEGCHSITGLPLRYRPFTISTTESEWDSQFYRAVFGPTEIIIHNYFGVVQFDGEVHSWNQTVRFRLLSENVLEETRDGTPTTHSMSKRYVRVKPVQEEQAPSEQPKLENQKSEIPVTPPLILSLT